MKPFFLLLITIGFAFSFHSCVEKNECDCNTPDLRPLTAEESLIIESSNDFSFDILNKINTASPNKNLFISPLSISTALSMTANGATGETKEGIKITLHQSDLTDEEINSAYKSLSEYLLNLDPDVKMQLANSNWYKEDYLIENEFKSILLDYYDAEVMPTDFADANTKDLINGWIENKTNGKIKDMLNAIPSNVVMYLINAIYLKATWQYQFDKEKTRRDIFYLADGSVIETDIMSSDGVVSKVYNHSDYQFVELPYGNGQFVFSVILPTDGSKIEEVISNLDVEQYQEMIAKADTATYAVHLPKFKIEYKIGLKEVLSSMGMEQSFGPSADFSDLFVEDLSLYISRVLHQSMIEVDEEGTEAAAATVVEIRELSSIGGTPTIMINQPFVFFIREKHSNSILFAGKLLNPELSN